ncbi:hypothetical protein ACS0TY_032216 [Phlomoides rotata]
MMPTNLFMVCHFPVLIGYSKLIKSTQDIRALVLANKTSKRVGCTTRLNDIRHDDGSWIISKIVTKHNHEIDPTFSPLMSAHMQLNVHMKRQIEANDIASFRLCKNMKICEVQSGGPQNLGCLPRDCMNFVDQRRRLRLGNGDAEARYTFY